MEAEFPLALAYDDVLLVPQRSEVLPNQADTKTRLTDAITLGIPVVSSPMDTVTESNLAIALAQEGGLGVIHRNLDIESQVREVEKVKRSANGVIPSPRTVTPDQSIGEARQLMDQHRISGLPVVRDGRVVGILTMRDLRFQKDLAAKVAGVMTKEHLVTAPPGTTLEQAKEILHANKVEKLILVDGEMRLKGLITIKDINKLLQFPVACRDERGRLRVGAAVGVADDERVAALIEKEVDLVVIDTAHGHSGNVLAAVSRIKKRHKIPVAAGNVATPEAVRDLVAAGADIVKIGIGPGSICTTRVVAGIGVPQFSAVLACARAAAESGTPVIADGGIRFSGDAMKALAAGAAAVMVGSMFAGTAESPGETVLYQGRSFKAFRGMGSLGAMVQGSKERYRQGDVEKSQKLVPEGVEGRVPFKGPVADVIYQFVGGIRAGMGYVGARTIDELKTRAKFVRQTAAGLHESHPHDVQITQEPPNYWAQ